MERIAAVGSTPPLATARAGMGSGPAAHKPLVVGVADMQASADPTARIITYALGSCIGLTAWDPVCKVGGMLHFMLAQPAPETKDDQKRPFMYATSGIPALMARMLSLGAARSRLVWCAAGAAEVMQDCGMFAIGQRNRTILRKLFWKENLILAAEDTGGNMARNMLLELDTGRISIKSRGEEKILWQK